VRLLLTSKLPTLHTGTTLSPQYTPGVVYITSSAASSPCPERCCGVQTAYGTYGSAMTLRRTTGKHGIADLWHRADGTPTKLAEPGSTPRRPRGQGSRWRAWYIDDQGVERTQRFGTKPPAEAWLTEQTSALHTGTHVDAKHGKATLATFYADWSQHQVWVPGTRRAMNLAINGVTFGDVAFSDLRTSHVQAWIKSMQDKPLKASTINTRLTNVRGVVRAAVRDRMLAHDVTDGVRLPRQRKASAAMSIPKSAEVSRLLGAAHDHFVAFIGLCAFGGLRLGEAAALQMGDVDFLKREVHVRRQVQRANGKQVEIRPPKYGSERTVYAPGGLIEMVSEHVRAFRPDGPDDRWLFPGEGDHPLHQNSVGYLWRKARDGAGVDYRLHDLRHFYASGLIHEGCDVVTVQRALGHGNASFTLNTYSHLWPNADDRTRKAATALFDQAHGGAYVVRTNHQ
jgi:integrase